VSVPTVASMVCETIVLQAMSVATSTEPAIKRHIKSDKKRRTDAEQLIG